MANGVNGFGAEKLAKYGLAGVCMALVALVGWVMNQSFELTGNHINHNTQVLTELKGSVDNLNQTTIRQIEVIEGLEDILRGYGNK